MFKEYKTGVYHTWLEIVEAIHNLLGPQYKGFRTLSEALYSDRQILDHISSFLLLFKLIKTLLQVTLLLMTLNKIIFCDHYETMQRTSQRLNYNSQALIKEKQTLQNQLRKLEEKLASLSIQAPLATLQFLPAPPTVQQPPQLLPASLPQHQYPLFISPQVQCHQKDPGQSSIRYEQSTTTTMQHQPQAVTPPQLQASTSSIQPQSNIFQILPPADIVTALQAQASLISAQGIRKQVF